LIYIRIVIVHYIINTVPNPNKIVIPCLWLSLCYCAFEIFTHFLVFHFQ